MARFLVCLLLICGVRGMRPALDDGQAMLTKTTGLETTVNALQWSSHWSCWVPANTGCKDAVLSLLPEFLEGYNIDFVNLGMFQLKTEAGADWDGPPPGTPARFASYDLQCTRDNIKILYNSEKWEVIAPAHLKFASEVDRDLNSDPKPANMFGCFNLNGDGEPDRVYGIWPFKLKDGDFTVIVVFSHFPHPPGGSSSSDISVTADKHLTLKTTLGTKISSLKSETKISNVLVIADLNLDMPPAEKAERFPTKASLMPDLFALEPAMGSEAVWETMNIGTTLQSATEYLLTCCSDKTKKMSDGTLYEPANGAKFTFAFDRILADFGEMRTVQPLADAEVIDQYQTNTNQCPMYVGAFHMPIIGMIQ